jgi:D-alanyl-lipoteichoic acid acyltransferase DltB (MBOAT superfamily)
MAFIPYYILILLVTIGIDYYAGMRIEDSTGKQKKLFLIVSIISTCTVLIIFKYFNFFNANFAALAQLLDLRYPIGFVNIILPIGLSFHTFQSLSYVVEVYRGKQKAERHFGIYSLYVMFYPQLVAGPIERPQNLLHQFYEKHIVDFDRIGRGLQRMLWGFFKKVVIADNLAIYVTAAYGTPHAYSGLALLVATFFFAIQIYCDFSGYSDIAIGSAQVMGFTLMDNFKNPYFAESIADFWRRWHISLSTWFKDYVYIPLGGSRVKYWKWCRNILVTFLLSGLWHGANWTYVVWGALHGVYLVASDVLGRIRASAMPQLHRSASIVLTVFRRCVVFVLVLLTWAFFRANTIGDAWYIVLRSCAGIGEFFRTLAVTIFESHSLAPLKGLFSQMLTPVHKDAHSILYFALFWGLVFLLLVAEIIDNKKGLVKTIASWPSWIRWPLYVGVILAIMNLGVTQEVPFIYFQF